MAKASNLRKEKAPFERRRKQGTSPSELSNPLVQDHLQKCIMLNHLLLAQTHHQLVLVAPLQMEDRWFSHREAQISRRRNKCINRLDNGLSQILSNDSALTSESNSGVMKHKDSSQSSNIQQETHSKNQDDYSRMTVHNTSHLGRSTSNVAEENMSKNSQLATILENGVDVSRSSFCGSPMSIMCQAQGTRPGEQLVNATYKCDPLLYDSLNSSGETPGSLTSVAKNSLIRHSSSPAGALSQVTSNATLMAESGYLERAVTSGNMGMTALASVKSSGGNLVASNRLSHHMNFLRQSSSPAQLLNQLNMDMDIPEIVDKFSMNVDGSSAECLVRCSSEASRLSNAGRSQGYIPSISSGSWEDGTMLSGNYEGIQNHGRKRGRDIDEKMISGLHLPEKLKGEAGSNSVSALGNHHFGLFKSTSAEMAMEKLLEDSVPCRIRAKRGCATHPRSIAERVRRTRISDRMRKLQELVPNMDKQTNTADMLDEAVEYVKLLQKQVQELSEKQKECDCASRKQHMLTKHGLVEEEGVQI
ncbi:hypothetical protein SUGI_1175290 [Cryptomeria japonica]|nr:hypothetical protein SUGI_1175290 [Cryptomeria japonica]